MLVYLLLIFNLLTTQSFAKTFQEQEIDFKTQDSIVLKGTITLPSISDKTQKVPAILLLPGSGPTDRNGNQPPVLVTDLLKQIAGELARNGIASFRFDKRAAHVNKNQWPKDASKVPHFFSWQHHQSDIRTAFAIMKNFKGIDPHRLAILGHSEGGLLAISQLEVLSPKALVLAGSPGRTFGTIITEQITALLDQQKVPPSVKAEFLKHNNTIIDYILTHGTVPQDIPQGLAPLYPPSAGLFLKDILTLDPTKLVKNYSGPVLVLNGELDAQVSPVRDAKALFQVLENRKNTSQTLYIVPSVSHNFKKITNSNHLGFEGPVDSQALSILTEWLKENL